MEKLELEDLVKYSKTVRVLYVEDDCDLRESSLGVFNVFFHNIDTARDGAEGFNYFEKKKYDLIITGIDMPNMNGIEMITKIREISKHITVLITSSDTKNFVDLIRLGIDGYILKPVEIKQFTSIIKKVIEKLKNKQELYEYKNHLEEKVEEKTKELELLNSSLEEKVKEEVQKNKDKDKLLAEQSKMAAIGEMIGNIAHQWRQPLSVITTAAGAIQLEKECNLLSDDELNKYCNTIVHTSKFLSKTVDDFRDFIKIGKVKNIFNIKEIIHQNILLLDDIIKLNNIKIIDNIKEDVLIKGYQDELSQVIMSVLDNSKNALIEQNIENKLIFISIYKDKNKSVLSIKDNANGISDDILPKIFEPYFTTQHQSVGTGLGLYIGYNMIREMNGNLEIKNTTYEYDGQNYTGAQCTISFFNQEN